MLISGAAAFLAAALPAALWTVTLLGRTSLDGLSTRWAGTFLLTVAALLIWTLTSGRPALAGAGLVPAAGAAGAVLWVLYHSDSAYHAFVYGSWWKGAALPASVALVLAAPVFAGALEAWGRAGGGSRVAAAGREARAVLGRQAGAITAVTLLVVGGLQAASFSAVATDDLIRYWAVVDAIAGGWGYPVSTGAAGGGQFYLVELPGYPALVAVAFGIVGHRYLALLLPLALANLALPLLFYKTARETGTGRWWAVWLSLALVCLPFYQVYALSAPEPEAVLAVALAGSMWLAMRQTRGSLGPARSEVRSPKSEVGNRWRGWVLLGLVAAAAVLVRPEGLLYAGALLLGLALQLRLRERGWLLAAVIGGAPVALFSAFLLARFGVPWPAGWTNVAGAQFLEANWRLVMRQNLPHYAAVIGLPAPQTTGPALGALFGALGALGLVRLWRGQPERRFVPLAGGLAGGLNLGIILLSPTYLSADLFSPPTFLRHLSVALPWLVPAFAALLPKTRVGRGRHAPLAVAAGAVLVLELIVLAAGTGRPPAGRPGVLTSDPTVLLGDLWRADDGLPALPFRVSRAAGRGQVTIDPAFDYLAFRERLFAAVRPYDLHVNDAGYAYVVATGLVALAGLGALAVGRTDGPRRP